MSWEGIAVTVFISMISILVGVLVTRWYSARRKLTLVLPSAFNLINLKSISNKKVSVIYGDSQIKSLWVIRLVLCNDGNFDIHSQMVHTDPKLDLGKGVKILDVEPQNLSRDTKVTAKIMDGRFLLFQIEYLKRNREIAYQVLLDTHEKEDFDVKGIKLDRGVVENTNLVFLNFETGKVPGTIESIFRFVRRFRLVLSWIYIIMGSLCYLGALAFVFYPKVFILFDKPIPSNKQTIPSAVSLFVLGSMLIFPMLWIMKKSRYMRYFSKAQKRKTSSE